MLIFSQKQIFESFRDTQCEILLLVTLIAENQGVIKENTKDVLS